MTAGQNPEMKALPESRGQDEVIMGLIEEASSAITCAERRFEIISRNISNFQTPGYKREVAYDEIDQTFAYDPKNSVPRNVTRSAAFSAPGVLIESGNALDIAVRGEGYFLVRDGDGFFLSRGGQFRRDKGGAIVDAQGRVLQGVGEDLVLDADAPEILPDGTVLSDLVPVGAIPLYSGGPDGDANLLRSPMDRSAAAALGESEDGEIAQGMIERSNVVLSDEMIGLIRTQRMAEAGAQLVRSYDQLIGQAVSAFGRRGG